METFDDFRKKTLDFIVEAVKIVAWFAVTCFVLVTSVCSLPVTVLTDFFLLCVGFVIGIVTNKFPINLARFKITRMVWKPFGKLIDY